ncbi:hypothetical protein [Sulfurirhabdus autotrophica]|uniref:Uncharacterized protein n=1 Tax=Sulfurirhabdus autotrophica TaxID=1706046 RepID=A0A4R3YFB7_9PROT|nr:hypothetical protein [Sulfurirhabdus autotrophica]TCV89604.1 hypothetical protein EDC63_102122 [Sulfurirhabdus autotrophica]
MEQKTTIQNHEQALESFAVYAWDIAKRLDTYGEWLCTSDDMAAVARYLNQLHLYEIEELAIELKKLAWTRATIVYKGKKRAEVTRAQVHLGQVKAAVLRAMP